MALLCFAVVSFSQSTRITKFEWRSAIGASIFMGDLGGSSGGNLLGDLDVSSIKYSIGTGLVYNLSPRFALRSDLLYTKLAADDAHSGDLGRKSRNLSFESNLLELSGTIKFTYLNIFRKMRYGGLSNYIFAGGSIFYFNPKAKLDGKWHELQPLGTEGQGLKPNTQLYNKYSYALVGGVGFRKGIARDISIGLELSFRKSFTDYIDDVSSSYYNYNSLSLNRGEIAAKLSYRGAETEYPDDRPRGNPSSNDNFSFVQIVLIKHFGKPISYQAKHKRKKRYRKNNCPDFKQKKTNYWK